jgi:type IV pilus assembly protein PilM
MLGISQVFGREAVVGIDIGSRLIKVTQAELAAGGRWKINQAATTPTPPDAVQGGAIVEKEAVAGAIRELMVSAGLTNVTSAVSAVAGGSISVRHVKIPRMNDANLRKSIRYEASKYISTSIDDCTVEFEIVENVGSVDEMYVLLVSVPNEIINSRTETLELAGLDPIAMDLEAFALHRALLEAPDVDPAQGQTIAILDAGASSTEVSIITHGQIALTRNIPIAGDHFTTALKSVRMMEWEDAEQLKKTVDMRALLRQDKDPEALALAKAVQPVIDELLREVRRSVNYYQTQMSEGTLNLPIPNANRNADTSEDGENPFKVTRVIVSGGSSLLAGIDEYMTIRMGIPTQIWNVFDTPTIDSSCLAEEWAEQNHPVLSVSIGLGIKELFTAQRNRSRRQTAQAA